MDNKNYRFVSDYSVAPYNFISLPNQYMTPYKNYKELPSHGELNSDLLSGCIEYEIVNETPLIVGSSKEGKMDNIKLITPFKNPLGQYVIPGNSIRGVMRNNVAVLSLSSLEDLISDQKFYFRSFGKGKNAKDYRTRLDIRTKPVNGEQITAPHRISGGYIYKDSKNKFFLVPAIKIKESSYFVVREQYLRKLDPPVDKKYMYSEKILDLIYNKEKYKSKDKFKNPLKVKLLKDSYRGIKFEPYCTEVSFDIKGVREVSKIGKPGQYRYEGYLMTSKFIQGKLVHYIITKPDFNSEDPNELSQENGKFEFIDFYNNDLLRTKKKIYASKPDKRDMPYFFLPDKEGKDNGKPIFYGKYEEKLYFGFSPYLRIPYDYSIKDLIPSGYKIHDGYSYVDAIFGFTNRGSDGKQNYKSRISFQDVICMDQDVEDKDYRLVTGEPHATSYASYLAQNTTVHSKEIKNYNDKDGRIRGIKQYLYKDKVVEDKDGNENVSVIIRPLKIGTKFKGKINFKNLKRDELGLIIWALKADENAYENIGYGKPYGFGRVKIGNIKVTVEDINKKYSSMTNDYFTEENKDELIEYYKKVFKEKFNGIDIEQQKSVKEFKTLKTLIIDKNHENDARYMMIEFPIEYYPNGNIKKKKNEFNQLLPLPTPEDLVKIIAKSNTVSKKSSSHQEIYGESTTKKGENIRSNYRNDKGNYRNKKSNDAIGGTMNNSLAEQLEKWKNKE